MSSSPTPPSLTGRDFDTNWAALRDYIRKAAPGQWNSFHEGDLGTALMDVIAYDATLLTFIADSQFRECFLDTLQHRESLRHFCRLTGYQPRRNSAASVEVLASASSSPSSPDYLLLQRGTRVSSKDGLPWELAEDYRILPGSYTPVRRVVGYGDVRARYSAGGVDAEADALLLLKEGESHALLVDPTGQRLPSDYNFGPLVGPGQILKLTSQRIGGSFGPAPDVSRREFAVTGTDKLEFDLHGNSVLYLDRPWDLADYTGKWEVESRSVVLVQGETREDRVAGPASSAAARGFVATTTFYPVLAGGAEAYVASGLLTSAENRSGLAVSVNGEVWRETAALLFEGPGERAYEVDFDHLDRALVKFGDGVNGQALPVSAQISVRYRTGDGAAGNVGHGSFDTTIPGTLVPASGNSPTVFLTNPYTTGSGGRDRETVREAAASVSAFVRTNDRAVTAEDYAYLASNFADPAAGRIARAVGVLHRNTVPREGNIVWVYAWAYGRSGQLGAPSLPLRQALRAYLDRRRMVSDEVVVVDGTTTGVPLVFDYRFSRSREKWEVDEEIRSAAAAVFAAQRPGSELLLKSLWQALADVPGVEMVLVRSPAANIVPEQEFELLSNSLLVPARTALTVAAVRGSVSVVVADPAPFYPGGVLMLWEPGRTPTVGEVEGVLGNVVTLKRHTPLRDSYTVPDAAGRGCEVYSSDYVGRGWQFERPVNVHVRYDTSFGAVEEVDAAIASKIRLWFSQTLQPEQSVHRAALEHLVSTTNGVTTFEVALGSFDGDAEIVPASLRERLVPGHVSINGVSY